MPTTQPISTYDCTLRFAYKFTGKERDTESGLDYFGARYYASSMGRWMSPDWSAKAEPVPYAKLENPQSLNLYGYVYNNPLSTADKDGHCIWDGCVVEVVATVVAVGLAVKGIHDAWKWWKKTASDIDKTNIDINAGFDSYDPQQAADYAQKIQEGLTTSIQDGKATALTTACAVPGTTCSGPPPSVPPTTADAVNAVTSAAAGTTLPDAPQPQPNPQPGPQPNPQPTPPQPSPQPVPPPPPPPKNQTSELYFYWWHRPYLNKDGGPQIMSCIS
jgi:RHS repeat-associated protein